MKQAEANISIDVWVDCPHCEYYVRIDGQLLELEVNPLKEANTDSKHEVQCPECGESFEVNITY